MQIGDILYTYDAEGNVTEITHKEGEKVLFVEHFTYDAEGNVTEQKTETSTL